MLDMLGLRNLGGMEIHWQEGRLYVNCVFLTSRNAELLGSFGLFAREVFKQRSRLVEN